MLAETALWGKPRVVSSLLRQAIAAQEVPAES